MKNLLLNSLFSILAFSTIQSMDYIGKLNDWLTIKRYQASDQPSEKNYPKAYAYLEQLRNKYPQAFDKISFKIASNNLDSPAATHSFILNPKNIIECLEIENIKAQELLEWILLHEAGHVIHKDMSKRIPIAYTGIILSITLPYFLLKKYKNILLKKYEKIIQSEKWYKTKYFIASCILYYTTCLFVIKAAQKQESLADDFANNLCCNPNAFEKTIDLFKGVCLVNDPLHPKLTSRIEKIEQVFEKKFGKTMQEYFEQ